MVVETNWIGKKIMCPSPLGFDFTLVSSAERANAVYRDLHGCHGGYFKMFFAFVVALVSLRYALLVFRKKHFYVILLMAPRVRMEAETVLGRKFELISTRVKRWSSPNRLPCLYIMHGSVVKSKTA